MKVFVKFLVLVGILGILAVVLVGLSLNALVKSGVETMAPKLLGVPVTLEDVDISLLSDGAAMRASLTQLIIKNPEGYETAYAASFPNIRVKVERGSVLTDTIVVEEVLIVAPAITFEGSLQGSNLGKIQENVKRATQSRPDADGEEKDETHEKGEDPEKTVRIHKVIVKDAIINVSLLGGQSQGIQVSLPDFELRDIGDPSGGTTFQKASAAIFEALYRAIVKAVMKSGKLIPKGIEQLGTSVKDLGKSVEKAGKELLKGLLNQ